MSDSNSDLIKAIVHYQQCLEKYTKRNDESRMLYCISKLYKMPIMVEHLEQTGVGRTVNSLRKFTGEVGDAAKSLVSKWKQMVMVVGEENEAKEAAAAKLESSKNHREEELKERRHREKSSSSSHRESDKKTKYENKEKSSSSYSNDDEPSLRKENHSSKHKSHTKEKETKHHKHKSSKRKYNSDRSDSDDDNHESTPPKSYKHYKSSKSKIKSSEDENDSLSEVEKRVNDKHRSSSKRKYADSDNDNGYNNQTNNKHKRYSENEESSESNMEDKQDKQQKGSYMYHGKPKEESLTASSKDNLKHHQHKHKDKKERKDQSSEEKTKRHTTDDHKTKEKHSSKEKAKSNSEKKEKEENSSKKSKHSSKHHDKEHKSSKKNLTQNKDMDENGIGSGSGTSFAEALGMLMPSSSSKVSKKKGGVVQPFPNEKFVDSSLEVPKFEECSIKEVPKLKKPEPLDLKISSLLPEITPNYRPLGNLPLENHPKGSSKVVSEEEALSAIMYNKISRTKVYSGNKVIWGRVPTLFELCTHVLQDNIDALEYTGGVPYSILKPVIERANPDQLYMLEHHNPYLIEDTDELWQLHCQKEFRTKRREEMESWREMYMRCLDEREAKLKALTANIKQSQDKSLPVRQTKLAYVDGHSIVKPPRSIARKQAKHGTGGVDKKPAVTPSSRLSAIASAGAAGQVTVPNPGARSAHTGNSSTAFKPKKAPLMQKTLALMKNRLFRR